MNRRLILPVLLALTAGACTREAKKELPRPVAAARVGDLLYGANLIADPQVNAKVGHYITQVDRDGASPASVLRELQPWLEEWVRRHPDRVARARLMPRPPRARARPSSFATAPGATRSAPRGHGAR
jgi:hypothetical protein